MMRLSSFFRIMDVMLAMVIFSSCVGRHLPPASTPGWHTVEWDAGVGYEFFAPHPFYTLEIPDGYTLEKGKAMTDRIFSPGGAYAVVEMSYWGNTASRAKLVADPSSRSDPLHPESIFKPKQNNSKLQFSMAILKLHNPYWTDAAKELSRQIEVEKEFYDDWSKIDPKIGACTASLPRKITVNGITFWRADIDLKLGGKITKTTLLVSDDGINMGFSPNPTSEKILASLRRE